jgi:hypothetical protein
MSRLAQHILDFRRLAEDRLDLLSHTTTCLASLNAYYMSLQLL